MELSRNYLQLLVRIILQATKEKEQRIKDQEQRADKKTVGLLLLSCQRISSNSDSSPAGLDRTRILEAGSLACAHTNSPPIPVGKSACVYHPGRLQKCRLLSATKSYLSMTRISVVLTPLKWEAEGRVCQTPAVRRWRTSRYSEHQTAFAVWPILSSAACPS